MLLCWRLYTSSEVVKPEYTAVCHHTQQDSMCVCVCVCDREDKKVSLPAAFSLLPLRVLAMVKPICVCAHACVCLCTCVYRCLCVCNGLFMNGSYWLFEVYTHWQRQERSFMRSMCVCADICVCNRPPLIIIACKCVFGKDGRFPPYNHGFHLGV